ncbi:hypothetical protein DH2020_008869 [Rehmannia glutinosa]|uniref:Plastid lipid-associated protein/fibrillin conserved domain-containing protein n=1 Tax=Rehmannia glutinosa TaxID=99300 RepID=A0ABR0X764_REHGL
MASMASVSQFTFKTFQNSSPNSKLIPNKSHSLVRRINFSSLSITKYTKLTQNFAVRAAGEDETVPERVFETPSEEEPSEAVPEKELSEIDLLKKQLVDSFYGTKRGSSVSSETRTEIDELISHLEAQNPTPAPNEALPLLDGKWILVYTTSAGLFPLLSSDGALPLVKIAELSVTIDTAESTVVNSVVFAGPGGATTSFSAHATYEVQSPKRMKIKFQECAIGTPLLTDSIELPETVEFVGQKIDLTPTKTLITSIQDTASSFAKTISSRPPLKFPIAHPKAESWLLTTYLDDDLRISRGHGDGIFVLIKEGSPLLTS